MNPPHIHYSVKALWEAHKEVLVLEQNSTNHGVVNVFCTQRYELLNFRSIGQKVAYIFPQNSKYTCYVEKKKNSTH